MRGIHTCCPETVPTINLTQNVVEMDGTRAFWCVKHYLGSEYSSVNGFVLDHAPYARSQVTVMLNTAVMRLGYDFSVNANAVFLTFAPNPDDKFEIRYFALTDNTSSILADSTLSTGMMIDYGGTDDRDGWIAMDGITDHSGTGEKLALFNWLGVGTRSTDYCEAYDAGAATFRLKALSSTFYDGTTLVTGKKLIKL